MVANVVEKIRVFLDSNILIKYFKGDRKLEDLFSSKILNKVQFAINPIVFQEILLINRRMDEKIEFDKLEKYLKILPIGEGTDDNEIKKLKMIRNHLMHSNDILIIKSSLEECDYLLSTDKELLNIGVIGSLKIIDPEEFFNLTR